MKTIDDFNFKNKIALVRVDFNVPINDTGNVTDETRIRSSVPTIKKILNDGGNIVLMSHFGRPNGVFIQKYSMINIINSVSKILAYEIEFCSSYNNNKINDIFLLKKKRIILLENLRFHKEEESGNKEFSYQLSKIGDIYVNDAFGTAHRNHSSTAIVPSFFEKKCIGYLMIKEINAINNIIKNKNRPVTYILGGAKVASKISLINNILSKIDYLLIGGGMAYTFVKAMGGNIGNSIIENDKLDLVLKILENAKKENVIVKVPVDSIIANSFSNDSKKKNCFIDKIPDDWQGLDIGPKSIKIFSEIILSSKTIFWNGPLGVFEFANFALGTLRIANAIVDVTKKGAFSLIGGGDSLLVVNKLNIKNKISYVSTGGGAMMELIKGKILPALSAIIK